MRSLTHPAENSPIRQPTVRGTPKKTPVCSRLKWKNLAQMKELVTAKSGLPYVRFTMYMRQGSVTAAYLAIRSGRKKWRTRIFLSRTLPWNNSFCVKDRSSSLLKSAREKSVSGNVKTAKIKRKPSMIAGIQMVHLQPYL